MFVVRMGYPPSVQELVDAFELKSKLTGFRLLRRLELYGFIQIDDNVYRGLRIVNIPPSTEQGVPRLKASIIEACGLLRKYAGDVPEVQLALPRLQPFIF